MGIEIITPLADIPPLLRRCHCVSPLLTKPDIRLKVQGSPLLPSSRRALL